MPMATPEAQREYGQLWIKRRRDDWIKKNSPCVRCGSWKDPEVDHRDPSLKEIPVRSLWGMRLDNPLRVAELAKCWVLCSECHKEKTGEERRAKSFRYGHLYPPNFVWTPSWKPLFVTGSSENSKHQMVPTEEGHQLMVELGGARGR